MVLTGAFGMAGDSHFSNTRPNSGLYIFPRRGDRPKGGQIKVISR